MKMLINGVSQEWYVINYILIKSYEYKNGEPRFSVFENFDYSFLAKSK